MSNLIPQSNNVFFKIWKWIKNVFYVGKNINKIEVQDYSENKETNDVSETIINIEKTNTYKKHVYVQDLDYNVEKKRIVNLCEDVIKNKKDLEELDLSDMVKIKKLLKH